MAEIEFRRAIREALDEELARDSTVVFFGEDVAKPGGVFAVTPGLQAAHGEARVFDTPISELALMGAAFGSAVCGLRPVVEIMFGDFLPLAMDGLVNQAAKYFWLSDEQASVPLVVRSAVGGGGRFGAIHSQVPIPWFHAVPGLKIACPATPADAKGLLKAAIRDPNPVLFLEHKRLYSRKGHVPDADTGDHVVDLGRARVVRAGSDLTLVTAMTGVQEATTAAEQLAADGVAVELIDVRTVRPLDLATILASVERTNRLVVVEEGPLTGGWAGEVLARVTELALGELDDAWRIAAPDVPVPYSPPLEDAALPSATAIVKSVRSRLGTPAGVR